MMENKMAKYSYDHRSYFEKCASLWKARSVSFSDVKEQAEMYWSPRQQAYDPTMMGASLATSIEPQIIQSFLHSLASDFYFSSWHKNKAKELYNLVENSGFPNAHNVAHNLSLTIFNPAAGSGTPGEYWGEREYYGMVRNLVDTLKMVKKEVPDYPGLQPVADWLSQHINDVDHIRETTEKMVERAVANGLKRLDIDDPSKYNKATE